MSRLKVLDKTPYAFGYVKKARKQYVCSYNSCRTTINPGEKYIERRPFWSGEVLRICLRHVDGKELSIFNEDTREDVTDKIIQEWREEAVTRWW